MWDIATEPAAAGRKKPVGVAIAMHTRSMTGNSGPASLLERMPDEGASSAVHHPDECVEHHAVVKDMHGARPQIVVLCGSTRFVDEFHRQNLRLTLEGRIVLSIGADTRSDSDLAAAGEMGVDLDATRTGLAELHQRKIDLADRVLILNVDGYIGEATRAEIDYAAGHGKPIDYLQPHAPTDPPGTTVAQGQESSTSIPEVHAFFDNTTSEIARIETR